MSYLDAELIVNYFIAFYERLDPRNCCTLYSIMFFNYYATRDKENNYMQYVINFNNE